MTALAIDVRHVSFQAKEHFYSQKRTVLRDLSFTVADGHICGFVGANGAGKTTTMQMLLGQLRPSSGELMLLGQPARLPTSRKDVGYLPERQYHPGSLTAHAIVSAHAALRGIDAHVLEDEVQHAIRLVGLGEHQRRPTRNFSKGMLQRLGIALAVVGRPKLLLLDEPLSGLDPPGRHLVRELLMQLKSQGSTVFFSTHILADVELLCDQVVVLRRGQLVFSGPFAELERSHAGANEAQVEVVGYRIGAEVTLLAENLSAQISIAGAHHRFIAASMADANKLAQAIIASRGTLTKLAPFGNSALENLLLDPQAAERPQP